MWLINNDCTFLQTTSHVSLTNFKIQNHLRNAEKLLIQGFCKKWLVESIQINDLCQVIGSYLIHRYDLNLINEGKVALMSNLYATIKKSPLLIDDPSIDMEKDIMTKIKQVLLVCDENDDTCGDDIGKNIILFNIMSNNSKKKKMFLYSESQTTTLAQANYGWYHYDDKRLRCVKDEYIKMAKNIDPNFRTIDAPLQGLKKSTRLFTSSCYSSATKIMILDSLDTSKDNWVDQLGNGRQFVIDGITENKCTKHFQWVGGAKSRRDHIKSIGIIGKRVRNLKTDKNINVHSAITADDNDSDSTKIVVDPVDNMFDHLFKQYHGNWMFYQGFSDWKRIEKSDLSDGDNDKASYHGCYITSSGEQYRVVIDQHDKSRRYRFDHVETDVMSPNGIYRRKEWDQCVLSIIKMTKHNIFNPKNEYWMFCVDAKFGDQHVENVAVPLLLESGFEYLICMEYYCCECIQYPINQAKTGMCLSVSCNYT